MTAQSEASTGATIALATASLASCGHLKLKVTGASMLPALRPGDVMEFGICDPALAEAGDIVLFRRDERLVVHRVVSREDCSLITQGDALEAPDPPVAYAEVLGRVEGLTRNGKRLRWSRPFRPGLRITRWLFRRFDLSSRVLLRWHRLTTRAAA